MSRRAKSAKVLRSRTPAKLYSYETLLERLPQDLQDMAAELGQFIQEEHAVVRQRDLARHRHVAATDQPHIRDGVKKKKKIKRINLINIYKYKKERGRRRGVGGELMQGAVRCHEQTWIGIAFKANKTLSKKLDEFRRLAGGSSARQSSASWQRPEREISPRAWTDIAPDEQQLIAIAEGRRWSDDGHLCGEYSDVQVVMSYVSATALQLAAWDRFVGSIIKR